MANQLIQIPTSFLFQSNNNPLGYIKKRRRQLYFHIFSLVCCLVLSQLALAESAVELNKSSKSSLSSLLKNNSDARKLNETAVAVLVFPTIATAGFMIGGQYGEGVLWKKDKAIAYFNTGGGSFGLQVGAQAYGYALFFMKESALDALYSTQGFEIGAGPSVVVLDKGVATSTTSISMQGDIYAFIFNQKGLMAGLGIQGNKITKLDK